MSPRALPFGESFTRFAAVGAIGFVIDAGILTLLVLGASWPPLTGRLVSMAHAITATWLLNRRYVFAARNFPRHVEYAGYFAIQVTGACLNFAIFAVCVRAWPTLARWPVVPLAAAAAVVLFFNFMVARRALYAVPETRS